MLCHECGTPMMFTYAAHTGWAKNCIKCGAEEAAQAPGHVGPDAGKQARIGYSAFRTQDFDRAEKAFLRAAQLCRDVPEYLWAALLARYGVKYCCVPTNRGRSLSYVVNYWKREFPGVPLGATSEFEQVCDLACLFGPQWSSYYSQECESIDRGFKQIRDLEQEGEAFDVFLCFKDTDEDNGYEPTGERRLLDMIYAQLPADGLRVFYAPRSMMGKAVYDYEGYIHHALKTAKMLVVVAGSAKNVQSEWVKSEWMRFLKWNDSQQERIMTCTVGSMSPSQFPAQLRNIQSPLHADEIDLKTAKWFAGEIQLKYLKTKQMAEPKRTKQKEKQEVLEKAPEKAPQAPPAAVLSAEEMYQKGIEAAQQNTEQGNQEAVKWYKLAADQGLAQAQSALAACYLDGIGVEADRKEAVRLCQLAADQGEPNAQYSMGVFYLNGIEVKTDYAKAFEMLSKSAAQGNADAQNRVGRCYQFGVGVDKNEEEAIKWYRLAVDQGNLPALNNLGYCYVHGIGVPKNEQEGSGYLRLAAQQGFAPAQNNLGIYYEEGEGADIQEAVTLYRLAAEQGNEYAIYNLAQCYMYGKGVEKNEDEAKRLYKLAAEKGFAEAKKALKKIEKPKGFWGALSDLFS